MATVLVVDDEFGIGEVLDAILSDEGYQVLIAINGLQALERLADRQVDLVLTDYMMPLMDGPSLIRAMAADERWRRIPVVLMSSLPADVLQEQQLGHLAFIRKPFRVAQVIETLRAALPPRA